MLKPSEPLKDIPYNPNHCHSCNGQLTELTEDIGVIGTVMAEFKDINIISRKPTGLFCCTECRLTYYLPELLK
jgi:hypothetical protein